MKSSLGPPHVVHLDGIVIPNAWSTANRVLNIAIHCAGEQEYLIESGNKQGKELKKLLGKRVKLVGRLSQKKSSPRGLIVDSYEVYDW